MIQTGGHFNPRITKRKTKKVKTLFKKETGGLGGAAATPMMVAEVMIRTGVQLNLCKKSKN